jgi:hypothetical protein
MSKDSTKAASNILLGYRLSALTSPHDAVT